MKLRIFLLTLFALLGSACSSKIDQQLKVEAKTPPSSGNKSIRMQGTWLMTRLIAADGPMAIFKLESLAREKKLIRIGPEGFLSIGGESVLKNQIERMLGLRLDWHANRVNDKTASLDYGWDRKDLPGRPEYSRFTAAAGSVDSSTILLQAGFVAYGRSFSPVWGIATVELRRQP
jgi:hypothetical protein